MKARRSDSLIPVVPVFSFELQKSTIGQIADIPGAGFEFRCRLFKVQYLFHPQLEQRSSFVPVARRLSSTPTSSKYWKTSGTRSFTLLNLGEWANGLRLNLGKPKSMPVYATYERFPGPSVSFQVARRLGKGLNRG
jgi:hypothetical protein